MEIVDLEIPGLKLITPRRHEDGRGLFCETYNAKALAAADITTEFVQDNQSVSMDAGTLRGLHYQAPPTAQAKLVRVVSGSVVDVAVDIRKGSPSFGRHVAVTLSDKNWKQLLVPTGFLHGFLTLEPGTEVVYKVSDFYDPATDGGVIWNDPDLAINWPGLDGEPVLSEKDAALPRFQSFESPFTYEG